MLSGIALFVLQNPPSYASNELQYRLSDIAEVQCIAHGKTLALSITGTKGIATSAQLTVRSKSTLTYTLTPNATFTLNVSYPDTPLSIIVSSASNKYLLKLNHSCLPQE